MSKTMTLSLGGKERTLDFGKLYFSKFYGQASGDDPLNGSDILLKPEKQFDFVVNIVYAGLMTDCKAEKRSVDFSRDDVEDWIGCMEDEQVAGIIDEYGRLTRRKDAGEAPAPQGA